MILISTFMIIFALSMMSLPVIICSTKGINVTGFIRFRMFLTCEF